MNLTDDNRRTLVRARRKIREGEPIGEATGEELCRIIDQLLAEAVDADRKERQVPVPARWQ